MRRDLTGIGVALAALLLGLVVFWPREPAPAAPVEQPAPPSARRLLPTNTTASTAAAAAPDDEAQAEPQELVLPLGEAFHQGALEVGLLRVEVTDSRGRPVSGAWITSPDCPVYGLTDDDGLALTFVPAGVCSLQARRLDGLLTARSPWVEVELAGGEEAQLSLVVPAERTGGLGIMIGEDDEGIAVRRVYPGTPADRLGLVAGDVIVEVDGLPTATLTLDEFIEVMTGPEGTDVEFVLAWEGDTGAEEEVLTLTRSFLDGSLMQW